MVRHDVNQETGNPRALSEALRLIRERSVDTSIGEESLLVLAAADADGVCSAHILTTILKREGISYSLQSVDSYTGIRDVLSRLRSSIRTVVLLNCGAIVDLMEYLEGGNSDDSVLIVIDSHRPIHLRNVKEAGRILVLDDDLGRGGFFPMDAIEDESDDDEDAILHGDDGEEADEYDKDFVVDDDAVLDDTGRPPAERAVSPATRKKQRRAAIREYYEGYYYGSPTSLVLYSLASDLGHNDQQLLWLAVVGLAGYLEMGYFSPDTFRAIAQEIDQQSLSHLENSSGNAERGLRFREDLRLVMYRHWSIFQAMWHTPYVYSRLELNRDHGFGTIQRMLVYAGLSAENYNQTYSSMSHSAKRLVHSDKFRNKCQAYGLAELTHYQFVRSVRMKDEDRPSLMLNELSASDLFFMITSGIQTKGFNYAMDLAINAAPLPAMHDTIGHSLDTHKDICIQAKMILDKKSWRLVDGFRFCVIDKPTSQIFQSSPHATRWLTLFLMDILAQRKHAVAVNQTLPFLMCVRNGPMYVCVGVDPQDTKSEFVYRFRYACEATAVKIQLNSFDFSLAQVPAAEFTTWTSELLRNDPNATYDDNLSNYDSEDDEPETAEGGDAEDGGNDDVLQED
jgi:cell division control protein 45